MAQGGVLRTPGAQIASEFLKKGWPVYVEGRLKTRKWTDKDGVEKYTTEIVADQVQLLGGRNAGGAPQSDRSPRPSVRPADSAPQPARLPTAPVDFEYGTIPF